MSSDEHQRRSPDCSFFTLYASIKSNPGRSKKSRGSKASRLSTQSNFTSVSEGPSAVDLDPDNDETMMSAAEAPPTKSVKGKKGAKSGRGSMKTKAKSSRIRQEESQITSSFIEPEDDDFEVKIAASPAPITNSKKRKSDEISLGNNDESVLQPKTKDPQSQLPSKRQRRTRASSSVTQTRTEPPPSLPQESEVSGPMTDAEEMPPPPGFASKKKGRGGRKRASSTARKASSASIASKASLRANVPDDEDIEAALEAELDRPLTDEEGDLEPVEIEKPKTRRLTRSKPGAKKGMASVAPTRRGTRASSVTVAEPSMAVHYPSLENGADDNLEVENGSAEQLAPDVAPVDSSSEEKLKKDKRSRKPPLEQSDPEHHFEEAKEAIISTNQEKTQDASQATRPQRPKGRKASRQISAHATQSSNMMTHNDGVDHVSDIGSSIIDTQTARDDSGHETDASVIKQTRPKRGAKKAPTVAKKGKGRKKAAPTNEDSVAALQMEKKDTQADKDDEKMLNVTANHAEGAETNASAIEPPEEKTEEIEAKISRKSEDKAGKDKTAIRDMSNAASPGRIDAAVELQDTPISLPAPSMHSTPRPVLSSQSSDAENQPPSSRPSALRPPLAIQSPSKSQIIRVPLAITPTASPSRGNFSKLQSAIPWTAVDLEHVFQGTPTAEKENNPFTIHNLHGGAKNILTSPEKKLTVEEWIHFNAQRGEEKLRNECERLVGNFEKEGVRALRTLEGIECSH